MTANRTQRIGEIGRQYANVTQELVKRIAGFTVVGDGDFKRSQWQRI